MSTLTEQTALADVITDLPVKHHRAALSLKERCDYCGAQAFVACEIKTGGELLFCGHHFHENEKKLIIDSEFIFDNRSAINAKPMSGIPQE